MVGMRGAVRTFKQYMQGRKQAVQQKSMFPQMAHQAMPAPMRESDDGTADGSCRWVLQPMAGPQL